MHHPGVAVEMLPWGAEHYLKTGITIPPEEMQRLGRDVSAILVGALGDSRVPDNVHARDILLGMRFQLDLYVNERPARLFDDRLTPLKGKTVRDFDLDGLSREHRGALRERRWRVQGRNARRDHDRRGAQHAKGSGADHSPRLRVGARARKDARHDGRQGERDRGARALATRVRGSRRRVSGHQARHALHRRDGDGSRAHARGVPGDRHRKSLRRHPLRSRVDSRGRTRNRAEREPASGEGDDVRARARQRAAARREGSSRTRWPRFSRSP